MKLNCIHCGGAFAVRPEQLGMTVGCPHCRQAVKLPKADEPQETAPADDEAELRPPGAALKNSISGLTSLLIHTTLFIIFALISSQRAAGLGGPVNDVFIGELPFESLSNNTGDDKLDATAEVEAKDVGEDSLEELEVAPPTEATDSTSLEEMALSPTNLSGSSGGGASFDLGAVSLGGGGGDGGNWEGMIQRLRRDGLDVVIVFDSTGSMGGEIREVKSQIQRIGATLMKLVPKSRISIVTYRDTSDEYSVKGQPLSGDIQVVDTYLSPIQANGGGDWEEAVQEGLRWAIKKNEFRPRSRKVILLFGDAPPHQQDRAECLRLAADFSSQQKGVVSTVTCRNTKPLPDFVDIAQAGGGEAFLTTDERQIMTQLMILVFGSKYRSKVVEAFELLGN